MKIFLASGNAHKKEELSRIFSSHEVFVPSDAGLTFDPEETGDSFVANALIKAKALHDLIGLPVIADDSGLCVNALGGEPGIHSARFGSENGRILSAEEKNLRLLTMMEGITDRRAHFVCSMVMYLGADRFIAVQETLEGVLVETGRGSGGFGYDPILFIPEFNRTVAELSPAEKDQCSHRGKAGRALARMIAAQPEFLTPEDNLRV